MDKREIISFYIYKLIFHLFINLNSSVDLTDGIDITLVLVSIRAGLVETDSLELFRGEIHFIISVVILGIGCLIF